jgi:hypothetical protein
MLRELRRYRKGVRFENPLANNSALEGDENAYEVPDLLDSDTLSRVHDKNNVICKQIDASEYMTLEEFRKKSKESLIRIMNDHGIYK